MASTSHSASSIPDRLSVEPTPRSDQQPVRSNYGAVPGAEFPVAVYVSVFAAFAWIVLASWLAFANDADADLALGIAAVLTVVFFALPVLIRLTAMTHPRAPREKANNFLASRVEIATGTLSGSSAWLQGRAHPRGIGTRCHADRRHFTIGPLTPGHESSRNVVACRGFADGARRPPFEKFMPRDDRLW